MGFWLGWDLVPGIYRHTINTTKGSIYVGMHDVRTPLGVHIYVLVVVLFWVGLRHALLAFCRGQVDVCCFFGSRCAFFRNKRAINHACVGTHFIVDAVKIVLRELLIVDVHFLR